MVKCENDFEDKRILIVDDEEFCLSTMKALLTLLKINYEKICDFCISGQEALDEV
jgi:CheY-like chemotaxis protein